MRLSRTGFLWRLNGWDFNRAIYAKGKDGQWRPRGCAGQEGSYAGNSEQVATAIASVTAT